MQVRRVFTNGGSVAITLPADFGFKPGEYVKLTEDEDCIIIERIVQ